MTVDGFNEAVPIEISGFVPATAAPEQASPNGAPTLDTAMTQTGNPAPLDAAAERAALRAEAAVVDLWVGHGTNANAVPHQGETIQLVGDGHAVAFGGGHIFPSPADSRKAMAGRWGTLRR